MIYNESNEKIILTGLGSYLKDDFKIDDIVIIYKSNFIKNYI